jgi:hypothetical protein
MINLDPNSDRIRLSLILQSIFKKLWQFLEDPEFTRKMTLAFG